MRKTVFVAAAVVVTAGILIAFFFWQPILDFIHQDEERPPVVVSNGSIVVEVPDFSRDPGNYPIGNKKGRLDNDGAAKKQRQKGENPGYEKTVDYADLWIGGASGTKECAALKQTAAKTLVNPNHTITIDTANGEITIKREPQGNKYDLTFDFPFNVDRKSKHRVELGNPHTLVSVTFNGMTCTFDGATTERWVQIWGRKN